MVKEANPAKSFQYQVEIGGQIAATAQECDIGDSSMTKNELGYGNKNIKTPGKVTVPDVTLQTLVSQVQPDTFAWNWFKQAQDSRTGRGELPERIKTTVFIKLLDGQNRPIKRWVLFDAWCSNIGRNTLGDNEDSNYMESLTITPDDLDEAPV